MKSGHLERSSRQWCAWRYLCVILTGIVATRASAEGVQTPQQNIAAHVTEADTQGADELLARKITISLQNVSLKRAVDSVSRLADVFVEYQASLLVQHASFVSLNASNLPLGVVLERILEKTTLRVVPGDQGSLTIVAARSGSRDSVAKTGTITGRVVDSASGRGLLGATVKIAGTKVAVVTGDSGRFTLQAVAPGDYVLSVKLFGFHPAERSVTVASDERALIRIPLSIAPNLLTGVVTTAVGDLDRRKIGNDVTLVNADSIMQAAPVKNVTDLLENRVPGLTVQHTSGVPGAPSRLRLRGIGSGLTSGSANGNNNNDPIIIIDGMRIDARQSTQRAQNTAAPNYTAASPLDQIDPNTVDKIEVFKGPSASSLYGSDAANGVIVITTKRGRAGTTTVNAALDAGLQYLPGQYAGPGYYNFGHTIEDESTSILCGSIGQRRSGFDCISDSMVVFQALDVPRLSMTTVGHNAGATVTASGGTQTLTYSLTASGTATLGYLQMPELYQDQFVRLNATDVPSWMKRPNTYKTWSGSANIVSAPFPGLQLQFVTSLANSNQQQSSLQGQLSALSSVYIDTMVIDSNAILRLNDYATRVTTTEVTSNNTLTGSWTRWTWFRPQATVGQSTVDHEDLLRQVRGINRSKGRYTLGRPTSQTRTINVVAQLYPNGRVPVNMGVNTTHVSTQDFLGGVDSLSLGVTTPSYFPGSTMATSSQSTGGWFVEPRFKVADNFFWSPGFRVDQSGVSGSNGPTQKSGGLTSLFPKMDFSWIAVDREGQRPLLGAITLFRPRIAFGVGGVAPDPTQLYRVYQISGPIDSAANPRAFTSVPYPGVRLQTVGNPILRPERSRELEGGGDLQLWGNRIALNMTGYYRLRIDAIQQVPLAPSIGGAQLVQYRNLGRIRNTGVELHTDVVLLQNSSTTWTWSGNYAINRNTVTSLNNGSVIDFGDGTRAAVGYPLGGRWGRPIIGYTNPPAGERLQVKNVLLGDSAVYLGSAQPSYEFPMSTSLALLGGAINVNVGIEYEQGLTQFASGSTQLLTNLYLDPSASFGQQAAAIAAWCYTPRQITRPGDGAAVIGSACPDAATLAGVVQTVSVLRLSTFSLSYNVPAGLRRRFGLPRTSIALQGSNLGLWTSYRGKDPDVNGTPVGEALQDNGVVPPPRVWGLRVTLN